MPSSDTRMLMRIPFAAQNSTMRVSIGMARCGVSPVVLMPILRRRGQMAMEQLDHLRQIVPGRRLAAGDVQVLDRAPERVGHHRLELRERHVRLAVAPLPVVAHRAAGVADPGAVVDEDGRPDRVQLGADERVDEVARHAGGCFREVLQAEGVGGHAGALTSVSRTTGQGNRKGQKQQGLSQACVRSAGTTGGRRDWRSASWPLRARRGQLDALQRDGRAAVDPEPIVEVGGRRGQREADLRQTGGCRLGRRWRRGRAGRCARHRPRRRRTRTPSAGALAAVPIQRALIDAALHRDVGPELQIARAARPSG